MVLTTGNRLGPELRRKKVSKPDQVEPPQPPQPENINNYQLNDRTPPLHSLPPLPLVVDNKVAVVPSSIKLHRHRNKTYQQELVPEQEPELRHRHRHRHQQESPSNYNIKPGFCYSSSSTLFSKNNYFRQFVGDDGGGNKITTISSQSPQQQEPAEITKKQQPYRPPFTNSSSRFNFNFNFNSSSSSSSSNPSKNNCASSFYRRPIPLLSACILAIFLISLGPFDLVTTVSGQVYGEIRRQYWLMCPTSGGNATINVTCQGAPTYGADLSRAGDADSAAARTARGPIIRIVELRAHLISDQKAWMGFGPRSCLYTRELNKTTGEIAMASLGSLPVPVDPQDNVSDMLMKNCQAQTYCLSTDSKNINARQFSETFKVPQASDVFHDSDKQMKVPVVLELGYLCTTNPSPDRAPNEMCASSAKNATKIDIPVKEDGSTVTTWLWSPNYQREDTPSQTSCECILRSSSPAVNVTLVAYHVRSYNSKTSGFRNVINQRIMTMYNDQCTDNFFEKANDPCIPALCRKSTAVSNGGGSLEYGETSLELRLSTECLFNGPATEREFFMRRVWFAIETTYSPSGETFLLRRHRRRRRNVTTRHGHRFVRKRRQNDEGEEGGDGGEEEAVDEGGDDVTGADGAGDEGAAADEVTSPPDTGEPVPTEANESENDGGGAANDGDGGGDETPAEETTQAPVESPDTGDEQGEPGEPTTEATTPESPDYPEDDVTEAPAPPAPPSKTSGGPVKPTVTVTCYNYARPKSVAATSGGTSSTMTLPSIMTTSAFLFQTIALLLFAAFANFLC